MNNEAGALNNTPETKTHQPYHQNYQKQEIKINLRGRKTIKLSANKLIKVQNMAPKYLIQITIHLFQLKYQFTIIVKLNFQN